MDKWLEIERHLLKRTFRHWLAYRKEPLCKTHSRRRELFRTNHFFATFFQMRQSHITFKQFNLTVNNKKFRSNRLEFQPSFIVKLLFITVLQSRGACFSTFREQSKFFKSGNLFVIYLDKLSIYKWTEPWNFKGRFPESWGFAGKRFLFSPPRPPSTFSSLPL